MKVAVGSDHRGFNAKQLIKAIVSQMGHECVDVGTDNATPVDYPDLLSRPPSPCPKQADRAI
jgi:ribose 5-phosphate isomerase RpiB